MTIDGCILAVDTGLDLILVAFSQSCSRIRIARRRGMNSGTNCTISEMCARLRMPPFPDAVAKSKTAFLREELSRRFIPYLRSRGFEQAKDSAKADGRSTFPFGTFIRTDGTVSDIIAIQFDKYSRPKFIVNFQKDPPEIIRFGTVNHNWGEAFRLHPRPKSSGWFSMRTFFGLRSPETCAKEVVDRLMNLFPEVENWFKDRTVGEHLQLCPYPVFPETRNQSAP